MKYLKYILICTLILVSCKSKKIMIDGSEIKNYSAKKVAKKHVKTFFNKETIDAKLKVNFKNEKEDVSFGVKMKIVKDEVIWLKGTKFITVFKAKITPTSVSYYSPLQKKYFNGDFSMLKELLGVEINFEQLQNLLLGQSLLNVKEEKQTLEIVENSYQLAPEEQSDLFSIFFQINPQHFKLNKQFLIHATKNQRLDILYQKYIEKNGEFFPEKINIKAKGDKKLTTINITIRSVDFNSTLTMPYKIPSGYKEIRL